jgi:hypothetical protein
MLFEIVNGMRTNGVNSKKQRGASTANVLSCSLM